MPTAHHITSATDLMFGDAYIERLVSEYQRRGVPLHVPTRHNFSTISATNDSALFASASFTTSSTLITNTIGAVLTRGGPLFTDGIARNVIITSAGNDSGKTFTITGTDILGNPVVEVVTGANIGIASSRKTFATVSSIVPSSTSAGNVKIGYGSIIGLPFRCTINNRLLVYANSKLAERYYVPSTLSVLGTAQTAISVVPTGGVLGGFYAASAANGANANAVLSLATGGTTVANMTLLSNYVANTTQSNFNVTSSSRYVSDGAVVAVATDGGGDGTGSVSVMTRVDPYVFTAADTNTATSTTGDVRGTIDLGGGPDGAKVFSVLQFVDASSTETARGVAQYAG